MIRVETVESRCGATQHVHSMQMQSFGPGVASVAPDCSWWPIRTLPRAANRGCCSVFRASSPPSTRGSLFTRPSLVSPRGVTGQLSRSQPSLADAQRLANKESAPQHSLLREVNLATQRLVAHSETLVWGHYHRLWSRHWIEGRKKR